jgi:ABC-type dipeptide/oligopeptide/nickel transport system permease subunit
MPKKKQRETHEIRRRSASQWAVAWRRFKRNKAGVLGLFMVCTLVFIAIFHNLLALYPTRDDPRAFTPFYNNETAQPPSSKYPFGTSAIGTDVFSEVIHGSVWALYVGILVTTITMTLAIVVGAIAGYFGGWVDNILMRITEIFLVFPSLLLILVFVRIFSLSAGTGHWQFLGFTVPTGLTIVIVILGIFNWASNARMVRGEFLRVRELEFVQAEKTLGASNLRIIFRHILPNILSSIIVVGTLTIAYSILLEAAVSFLGFGDVNTVTWGQILQENFSEMRTVWWAEVFPGLAILFSVFGFNLLGDGLSDALNPRLRE